MRSVKDVRQYEALRSAGYSKGAAAAISNASVAKRAAKRRRQRRARLRAAHRRTRMAA